MRAIEAGSSLSAFHNFVAIRMEWFSALIMCYALSAVRQSGKDKIFRTICG
jgi:hypothetical protein